ncbi:hypothetical protein BTUL_0037g00300 [Botrytis tulipae]|uniref:Uncharacterized protein n=1 Tax=Botrytis tulipae TaxID=87230 RepID=A0A4Z1EX35_9HELO|nr:hypothetical protein BTUL_0037g00300 [Botrytis tulipae]
MARTIQLGGKEYRPLSRLCTWDGPFFWQGRILGGGYDEEGVYDVRFTCSRDVVEMLPTLCIYEVSTKYLRSIYSESYPPGHRSQHKPGTLGPPSTSGKERCMNEN